MTRRLLLPITLLAACSSTTTPPAGDGADAGTTDNPDATTNQQGFAPLRFEHKVHSFAFDNYVNSPNITNLTPVEMKRMFGDSACAAPAQGDSCTLTPPMEKWMEATNNAMNGGHCEGMAVLSLIFAAGRLNPSDFGAQTAFGLQLDGNAKLQREIAYWWATQGTEPTQSGDSRGKLTPNEVVQKLKDMISTGGELYSLGLYKRDGTGGHANTAYAVEERDSKAFVKVYENNFPNDTLSFEIDPAANTWRYMATTNPNEPGSLYDGDATTKSFTITPLSSRLGMQTCPTCGTVMADGRGVRGAAVSYREVSVGGDSHLTLADSQGRRTGYVNGALVNEIPGVSLSPTKREPSTWDDRVDPIYRVPLDLPLKVTLSGVGLGAPSMADVILTAPGYAFAVEGVNVDPGQQDEITFSGGTQKVTYTTAQSETPEIAVAVTFEGADYLFVVKAAAEATGVQVELVLDAQNGQLELTTTAQDGSVGYDLRVERRGDSGTDVFVHRASALGMGTALIEYGMWQGNGSPMRVGLDTDGDGDADSMEMVSDDG